MIIQISKNQALLLWKNNNIILRSKKKIITVSEKENANNNQISNHNGRFFLELKGSKKEKALKLMNKRLIIGIISSLFFCFSFMNFAIYTNSKLDLNFYLTLALFSVSFFSFQKAIDSEEIDKFILNLKKENI